ncbi:hypothetical protein pb186bvf_020619 [Paramecium bursaria]
MIFTENHTIIVKNGFYFIICRLNHLFLLQPYNMQFRSLPKDSDS